MYKNLYALFILLTVFQVTASELSTDTLPPNNAVLLDYQSTSENTEETRAFISTAKKLLLSGLAVSGIITTIFFETEGHYTIAFASGTATITILNVISHGSKIYSLCKKENCYSQ